MGSTREASTSILCSAPPRRGFSEHAAQRQRAHARRARAAACPRALPLTQQHAGGPGTCSTAAARVAARGGWLRGWGARGGAPSEAAPRGKTWRPALDVPVRILPQHRARGSPGHLRRQHQQAERRGARDAAHRVLQEARLSHRRPFERSRRSISIEMLPLRKAARHVALPARHAWRGGRVRAARGGGAAGTCWAQSGRPVGHGGAPDALRLLPLPGGIPLRRCGTLALPAARRLLHAHRQGKRSGRS